MSPEPTGDLYVPYWVSSRRPQGAATGWVRGEARKTAREALELLRAELDAGRASWGCLVRLRAGRKTILDVRPQSARKLVRHYLELEDLLGDAYDGTSV